VIRASCPVVETIKQEAAVASTALIVGAGSGISACFARLLATEGYEIALASRDRAKLARLAAETRATTHACDAVLRFSFHRRELRSDDDLKPVPDQEAQPSEIGMPLTRLKLQPRSGPEPMSTMSPRTTPSSTRRRIDLIVSRQISSANGAGPCSPRPRAGRAFEAR